MNCPRTFLSLFPFPDLRRLYQAGLGASCAEDMQLPAIALSHTELLTYTFYSRSALSGGVDNVVRCRVEYAVLDVQPCTAIAG